jgi:hypothetical protein
LPHIAKYFIDLKIFLKDDNGNVFTDQGDQGDQYTHIQKKLFQNTADINAIRDWLTGEFMVDPNELDDSSEVTETPESSQGSSASSQGSRHSNNLKNFQKLRDYTDINRAITDPEAPTARCALAYYLGLYDSDSCSSGSSWKPANGSQELGGGSLPMKRAIKKSITTRKNKNKNRTKSKAPFRRGTFRIKRMIKSKLTRNKTCKRRAPNVKHKNNKTMRRYRRVRK